METKKFELTEETIKYYGHTLYRIIALKDFGGVRKGDLGGYVEKESNLSQFGECWISGYAKVYDDAFVYENARISHNVNVFGRAEIYGNAWVYGDAEISGDAEVCGDVLGGCGVFVDIEYRFGCSELSAGVHRPFAGRLAWPVEHSAAFCADAHGLACYRLWHDDLPFGHDGHFAGIL